VIAYAQALETVLAAATPLQAETAEVADAAGRTLAVAVRSPQDLPPFDNSAMDGFALRCAGQRIDAGCEFDVRGWQAAGDAHVSAGAGDGAWEIMTGARLPGGLDSVVPVEQVQIIGEASARPSRIRLREAVEPGQFVRLRGQDVVDGERVLPAGTRLETNAVALLHALGVARVSVVRRPSAAVISTGSELVGDAGRALESGQIRDSNQPYLVARLCSAGCDIAWQGAVGDQVEAFDRALDEAVAAGAQVILSTGAVSAGRYDFIPAALRARGARILFHKVAIRPGKPILFARLPAGALYFGLPGNPASAAVGQRFFVEPALRRMLGLPPEAALSLPLQREVRIPQGLRFHARARVELDADGALSVRVLAGQESFRLASSLAANAWAVLDAGTETISGGSQVQVYGLGHAEPLRITPQERA